MAWDTHERPGISGDWPGLAGLHQGCSSVGDQLGNGQDGGNGVEDIQRQSMTNQNDKESP